MSIHRCPRPPEKTTARAWSCPDCGASYTWSKRMIGREMTEGWYRNGLRSVRASATSPDREFNRMFNWTVVLVVLWTLLCLAVIVGVVAQIGWGVSL